MKESYKFWLGLLNSKLFWFFIQQTGYVLRGGYFTFKTNYVQPFPIPQNIPSQTVSRIEKIVTDILKEKQFSLNKATLSQEAEIDQIIFDLYGISEFEMQSINKSTQ